MKQVVLFFAITMIFAVNVNAQNKKEKDQKAIKEMCGCYEVGFNFAETFNYSKDSTYVGSKVKHDSALEWVELVEDKDDKIVMQHLLIVGRPDQRHIIKHWRQDWLFENRDLYMYDANNKWSFIKMSKNDVKGQWTQKVYQVDDSPRYEGSATWVHVDGKSYWENTTDAPLPRREYTKRNDYNLTVRRNRHEITSNGWNHDQDNDKVIREAGKEDVILAQEKGLNTYVKVDDSKCKAAQKWWKENKDMWRLVRNNWDNVFSRNKDLKLAFKVEDKRLYQYLFNLEPAKTKNKEVKEIITSFVK
ncbi:MAG: hypothetical protein BM557_07335 [Flavobacterium sp. MedPE-SWcel]|uniref:DUF6607 family protein n=1 Tax=uncultured Flavobacterium sp. TaxID=165435 RepID=UPI00090F5F35|nr:DUF6607 family protein [uncultured Flavobacterium sp.]OIQ18024.1 MAG: hypothetical protein BM557_07335 [Flavobacterium sp. MedPE-SWcel]